MSAGEADPVRVLLVDDQPLFREGLRTLLSAETDIDVMGEAGDGAEALRLARTLRPQVVLMDLRMPTLNGVAATRQLKVDQPDCRVIVLTTFETDEEVFDAVRAGAVGYLLKDVSRDRLIEAVRLAARGQSLLEPSVAAKVLTEFTRLASAQPAAAAHALRARLLDPLSERELDVLRHLAHGKSNKEIAVSLRIAEGTVKNHMSNVLSKLGVLDRTQAALRARDLGLI